MFDYYFDWLRFFTTDKIQRTTLGTKVIDKIR